MSKILYYIFFLLTCELVLSEEFQNHLGDENISDDYPNLQTRGIIPTNDYARLKIADNQDIYVNLIAGNLIYKRLDYYLYDIGFPIVIEFTYNSGSSFKGRFGNQWQLSYNIRFIENNFNKNLILIENDDRSILFEENKSQYVANYPNYKFHKNENSLIIEHFNDNHYKLNDYIRYNFNNILHNYINSIEDRNSNKINFIYNSEKQLVSIKYPSGRNINFFYDDNLLSKISVPNYGNINYQYDTNRNLKVVEYPNDHKVYYHYDSDCNFLNKIINQNDTIIVDYENSFLVKKLYKANSNLEFNFEYDFDNLLNKLTENKKVYEIHFDSLHRTTKVTKYGDFIKSVIWDTLNRITNFRDANNQDYKYIFSKDGNLAEYINPNNKRIKFDYESKFGRVNKININKSQIDYELDANSNYVSIKKNGDVVKNIEYDNFGQITKFKNVNDEFIFLYDGLGNFKRIIINNDLEFSLDYNNLNNLTNISEIGDFNISANYNKNRIDIVNNYDKINKSIFYNYQNRIDSIYDNDKIYNRYFYDNSNRLIRFSQDSLYNINFSYKSDSLIKIATPLEEYTIIYNDREKFKQLKNVNSYEFKYDKLNRLIEKSINGQNIIQYAYNAESMPTIISFPSISSIELFYDDLNRINRIQKQNGKDLYYSWDNYDRLISLDDNANKYTFDYFENSYTLKLPSSKLINITFDNRFKEITYLDYSYKINYDRYNRIASIFRNNNELFRANYSGNLISQKFINSKNELNYYYQNNKIEKIVQNGTSGIRFFYDNFGRIIRIENDNIFSKYNYDTFNRIISINLNDERITNLDYTKNHLTINNNNHDYKYDFVGNNLIKISNPNFDNIFINYTNYIFPNKLVGPEGVNLNFEFNNLTKVKTITDDFGNKTQFNYDDNENLVSLLNKNSFSRSFKYNEDNQIIEWIDFDGGLININYNEYFDHKKVILKNKDSINFKYDNNQYLEEFRNFNGSKLFFDYDNYGNLIRLFDFNDTINYIYDNYERLISTKFENDYQVNYNFKNNLISQITINDSIKFDLRYDKFYNLNKVILNDNAILSISKDKNDRIIFSQFWQNRPTLYTYNELDLVVESNSELSKKFNYDKLGRLIQIVANNDYKENLLYDNNSRIISRDDFNKNSYNYQYDKMRNLTFITRNVLDSIKFTYDRLNKVNSVKINNKNIFSLEYDAHKLKSIFNYDNKIELKWLDYNYKNLLLIGSNFVDSLLIDNSFRIYNTNNPIQYMNFGLIGQNSNKIIEYDKFCRIIRNDCLELSDIRYFGFDIMPNEFKFKYNSFYSNFNFSNKLNALIYKNDTFKINQSQFSNLETLEKNQYRIYDLHFDGMGNYDYIFPRLDKFSRNFTEDLEYGFEKNKANFEYNFSNNLRSVNHNNKKFMQFEYDENGNIVLNDDAEGNLIQLSYINKKISEINYSNGKFIKYFYDSYGNVNSAYSNSILLDSISYSKSGFDFDNISLTYFNDNFNIYKDSNIIKLNFGNKDFILFSYNNSNNSFILNNNEHCYLHDFAFFNNSFRISFENNLNWFIQNLEIEDKELKIADEIDIFENLSKSLIENDTIINNEFDELNRLTKSKYGLNYSFEYNDLNNISYQIINNDSLKYDYSDRSKIVIEDIEYYYNANNSINKIINALDSTLIFYDFADRISNVINKDKNIQILYNSLGKLSSIIDIDTSYYFHFTIDSIEINLILNKSKNIFDLYLSKIDDYKFPVIKYNVNQNQARYLIRNSSGFPVLLIDENNDHFIVECKTLFGDRPEIIKDFAIFFKNYLFIEQLGIFFDNGEFIDPSNNLQYNNFIQKNINGLSKFKTNDIFNNKRFTDDKSAYFHLNFDEIIQPIDPINDDIYNNIINRNKQQFIKDEINFTFNNFKVFNLNVNLETNNKLKIEDISDINSYKPNIERIINSFESELKFLPIFPNELTDSILIDNLKLDVIHNPELYLDRKNNLKQILNLLELAEVDSNFVLFSKIKSLNNIFENYEINDPSNIIELNKNTFSMDDVNELCSPNQILKHISIYQKSINKQDSILNTLNQSLFSISKDSIVYLNKPYFESSDLKLENSLRNSFLPINNDSIERLPTDNLNRLLKLITTPYPKFYIPSLLLYDKNDIQLPIKNEEIDILGKFILQKRYNQIK